MHNGDAIHSGLNKQVNGRRLPGGKRRPRRVAALWVVFWAVALGALSGCAADGMGYYWQSISGHVALLRVSRPMAEVIDDPATDAAIRAKLQVARTARAWAVQELSLPDNGSYTRYAQLDRPAVLWNVFAAGPLSLRLKTWCFPVAGCVGYRGYYDEQRARQFADQLAAEGLDVRVGAVPAYSTLGWFDDPLPSPVLRYPETEMVRLIFHELAHQVLYLKGDSTFNESFATAVETIGVERWLTHQESLGADPAIGEQYRLYRQRKRDFLALLQRTRAQLAEVYRGEGTDQDKLDAKQRTFERLRNDYDILKQSNWNGYSGYDRWFAQSLGNAHLAAVGAYNDRVPAFLGMFDEVQGNFVRFYELARQVSALKSTERNRQLDHWQQIHVGTSTLASPPHARSEQTD